MSDTKQKASTSGAKGSAKDGTAWAGAKTRHDASKQSLAVLAGLPVLQDRESDISAIGRMLAELRSSRR